MPYKNKADKAANGKQWRAANPSKGREYQRIYRANGGKKREWQRLRSDPSKYARHLDNRKVYRRSMRQKAIDMYGGFCTCCGESIFEFLAFHHINGDGTEERNSGDVTIDFYLQLLKSPLRDDIQLQCHNCHMALTYYGFCPHEKR